MTPDEAGELVEAIYAGITQSIPAGSIVQVVFPSPAKVQAALPVLSLLRQRTGCEFLATTAEWKLERLGQVAPRGVLVGLLLGQPPATPVTDVADALQDRFLILERDSATFVLESAFKLC